MTGTPLAHAALSDVMGAVRSCAVPECARPYLAKGLCRLHYDRQWATGSVELLDRSIPLADRLWPRINKRGDGCWVWTGALNASGYGVIGLGAMTLARVHRLTYEMLVGPIPEGLQLDHLCRVRACCNPTHLEPVTNRENFLRGEHPIARAVRSNRCARDLHDMAVTAHVRPNGTRYCRACASAAKRRREGRAA